MGQNGDASPTQRYVFGGTEEPAEVRARVEESPVRAAHQRDLSLAGFLTAAHGHVRHEESRQVRE
jgi:hypothetical protein